jgi:hypothetical protein
LKMGDSLASGAKFLTPTTLPLVSVGVHVPPSPMVAPPLRAKGIPPSIDATARSVRGTSISDRYKSTSAVLVVIQTMSRILEKLLALSASRGIFYAGNHRFKGLLKILQCGVFLVKNDAVDIFSER